MEETLVGIVNGLRASLQDRSDDVRVLISHKDFKEPEARSGQFGEMKANLMLAYRHLEDARMRLGKVIQHAGDGTSSYDKKS